MKSNKKLDIYDMIGNVWEWCQDKYNEQVEIADSNEMPKKRIKRGGSWSTEPKSCIATYREKEDEKNRDSNIGFRVVLKIEEENNSEREEGRSNFFRTLWQNITGKRE